MQDKNFIIFIIFSMMIILAWTIFFGPKPKPRTPLDGNVPGATVADGRTGALPGSTAAGDLPEINYGATAAVIPGTTSAIVPGATAGAAPTLTGPPEGKTVTAKTDVFDVEFTSVAAAPLHWRLLDYPSEKCQSYRVDLKWPPFTNNPPCNAAPVDLVDPDFGAPNLPFAAQVSVDSLKVPMNKNWNIESTDLVLGEGDTVGEVVFTTILDDGRQIKKIYRFRPGRYDVELEIRQEGGTLPRHAVADLAMFYDFKPLSKSGVPRWNYNGAEGHNGKAAVHLDPKKVLKADGNGVSEKSLEWAGMTSDYFLIAILTEGDAKMAYVVKYMGTDEEKKSKTIGKRMVGWARLPEASPDDLAAGRVARVRLFMGPKDKQTLAAVKPSLQFSIDYGMLKILVQPLLWALAMIEKFIPNYGLAIIVLTVTLRMGMFPLTRKSQKSMKQIQKLQPEIQKIREKYPDDRMKQNEETQVLWRKNKINPAMGCLPMLLQMPIFFAFYKALLISMELRQAPFFGWIIDLSARDPLYIWPVLMGGTQLAMQKMTPSQMDPVQQKVFLIMPIVFMYILRDFPAGLLIYWTFSNLVGVAQQIYVNRQPD